jgi:hypothetical protein
VIRISTILLCLLLLTSCRQISQDDFSWETEEILQYQTDSFGSINLRLLVQSQEVYDNRGIELEEIGQVFETTMTAFENRYGPFEQWQLDWLRNITMFISNNNSSLWEELCYDRPHDVRIINGCTWTNGWLFQQVGYNEPGVNVQIAVIQYAYQRGEVRIWAHELVHSLLWIMFNDADGDHSQIDAWENGGVVLDAIHQIMVQNGERDWY